MSKLISLGAIKKSTGEYVYPRIADKKDTHICPDCEKDLTLCRGKIRVPHFRHKAEKNPCDYYNHPSESQIQRCETAAKDFIGQKNADANGEDLLRVY